MAAQLKAIDREITGYGSSGGRPMTSAAVRRQRGVPRGRRPRDKMNLVDALKKVLARRTLLVSEACVAVQEIGYQTRSANFRTIVNQALIANRAIFTRVSRGRYAVKK